MSIYNEQSIVVDNTTDIEKVNKNDMYLSKKILKNGIHFNPIDNTLINYYNDLMHGSCYRWFPNEQLYEKYDFILGKKHGICCEWYDL